MASRTVGIERTLPLPCCSQGNAVDRRDERGHGNRAQRRTGRILLAPGSHCCALGLLMRERRPAPGRSSTRLIHAPGKIVPIPASIPHEAGDMVDRRIVPDLRWIASATRSTSPTATRARCPTANTSAATICHVKDSDHYNGLAVDLVPLERRRPANATPPGRRSPASPLWAEPVQNEPVPPFRWVGYEGDAGHGCGNHLHLSWNHAPAAACSSSPNGSKSSRSAAAEPKPRKPRPSRRRRSRRRGLRAASTRSTGRRLDPRRRSRRWSAVRSLPGRFAGALGATSERRWRSIGWQRCRAHADRIAACRLGSRLAGCGSQDDTTPVACLEGTGTYLKALRRRRPARSSCAARRRSANAWPRTRRPATWRRSAKRWSRRRPSSTPKRGPNRAATPPRARLPARRRRTGRRQTEGIHADLIRRLTVAARYSPDDRPAPCQPSSRLPRRLRRRPGRRLSAAQRGETITIRPSARR